MKTKHAPAPTSILNAEIHWTRPFPPAEPEPVTPHHPAEDLIELHEKTGDQISFFLEVAPPPPPPISDEDDQRIASMVIVMTGDPSRLLAIRALIDSAFL
jgi:acid phosphatase class B